MKVVKRILYVIIATIALVFIVAVFVPKDYSMERSIQINKPNAEVFEYVKYLKNQDNFSVWSKMDPDTKRELSGIDGTVGCISSWESNSKEVGKGQQEITQIIEGERINFELRFIEPFEATDYAYFATESVDSNSTIIKWGFDGKISYPMNIMLLWMNMEEMLGPDLEKGLQNLKEILEE